MIFYHLLLLLLILDVLPYGVLTKPDRADKITTGPKMVPQVGLLFQFRVALEKLERNLAFDDRLLPLAQRPDIMLDQFLYGTLQYAKPVLWNPNNMIEASR